MNYEQTWPPLCLHSRMTGGTLLRYRTWALASADWTKQGTMAQRMDKFKLGV